MKKKSLDSATQIIAKARYATVATVCPDGQPWNTPVAVFTEDARMFYWVSWADSQHSKNIAADGRVFLVLYDSSASNDKAQGVYVKAEAKELNNLEEVSKITGLFKDDPYLSTDAIDFLEPNPPRVYCASAKIIWMNDEGEVDGQYIDTRKQVWP